MVNWNAHSMHGKIYYNESGKPVAISSDNEAYPSDKMLSQKISLAWL